MTLDGKEIARSIAVSLTRFRAEALKRSKSKDADMAKFADWACGVAWQAERLQADAMKRLGHSDAAFEKELEDLWWSLVPDSEEGL